MLPLPPGVWEGVRLAIVALLGLFSYIFSYVMFVLSLFVLHPFFFGCLGKAVPRDCDIS